MTEQQIKQQYEQKHGRPMSQADYDAFLKLTAMLGVADYASYQDAQEKAIRILQFLCDAAKYLGREYVN